MYPTFLKIPHKNEIIWTKRGVRSTPRTPSGSATGERKWDGDRWDGDREGRKWDGERRKWEGEARKGGGRREERECRERSRCRSRCIRCSTHTYTIAPSQVLPFYTSTRCLMSIVAFWEIQAVEIRGLLKNYADWCCRVKTGRYPVIKFIWQPRYISSFNSEIFMHLARNCVDLCLVEATRHRCPGARLWPHVRIAFHLVTIPLMYSQITCL